LKGFYRKLSGIMPKRTSDVISIYRNNYKKQKLDTCENKVEYISLNHLDSAVNNIKSEVKIIELNTNIIKSEVNNIKLELSTLGTNINKSINNIESMLFKMVVKDT
jgi:hypothetical protein